jgi:hypothetical protein
MFEPYQTRSIKFVEVYNIDGWKVKIYSIARSNDRISEKNLVETKNQISHWLIYSSIHQLPTYNIATLIIHEGREGCFAIINWWFDENMLQNYVYLKRNGEKAYAMISQEGIVSCVWEMAIWWHERNAWVNHILKKHNNPDFDAYLNDQIQDCYL